MGFGRKPDVVESSSGDDLHGSWEDVEKEAESFVR